LERGDRAQRSRWAFFNSLSNIELQSLHSRWFAKNLTWANAIVGTLLVVLGTIAISLAKV
jgi:hypothetical protein